MQPPFRNIDCRNYAPVDVVKGICHVRKHMVPADDPCCEKFERLPKCKCCRNYRAGDQEYTGVCEVTLPETMAYPDMCAVTCEWFDCCADDERV